jgi:hypothetical protein
MKQKPHDDCGMPSYVLEVLRTVSAKPGTVMHVEVLHGPKCKLLRGRRECTCSPEVRPVRPS